MPFTVAHAAAVLPLHSWTRRRLPLSALMIGSMAPDFAYFVSYASNRMVTHSLKGLLTFSLPTGLAVWLVFVWLLERPTIRLLPDAWRTRLAPTGRIDASLLLRAALAIVLGAATHLAWDAFTHRSTAITELWPSLRDPVFGALPLYQVLQYASSAFGMAALALWAFRLRAAPPSATAPPGVPLRTRLVSAGLFVLSSCVFAFGYYFTHAGFGLDTRIFFLAIGGMTGAAAGWCAVAVWIRLRPQAPAQPADTAGW